MGGGEDETTGGHSLRACDHCRRLRGVIFPVTSRNVRCDACRCADSRRDRSLANDAVTLTQRNRYPRQLAHAGDGGGYAYGKHGSGDRYRTLQPHAFPHGRHHR